MRGLADHGFPLFNEAAAKLRADGHEVFNPAENDVSMADRGVEINIRNCLGEDLAWICAHADAVYLLPNWRNSKGATAERAVALALGLFVVELPSEPVVAHHFDVVA